MFEMKMVNDAQAARCCLLLYEAHVRVACSPLVPLFSQDFGLSASRQKFLRLRRAEGVRSQCMVAILLPARG